jgi:hypothetical protein
MNQHGGNGLGFSLIAICQNPLLRYSQSIATCITGLRYFLETMAHFGDFKDLVALNELPTFDDTFLAEFNLTESIIRETLPSPALVADLGEDIDIMQANEMFKRLAIETKATIGEYRSAARASEDVEWRVQGRKKDYGLALHKWVEILAKKNALQPLIESSNPPE